MKHPAMMILLALATHASGIRAADSVNLAGEWRFALDPQDLGAAAQPADWKFPDRVRLPGTPTAQGFGDVPSLRTRWTGVTWRHPNLFREWQADDRFKMPFCLQPDRYFAGPAWYQRDFTWPGGGAVPQRDRRSW